MSSFHGRHSCFSFTAPSIRQNAPPRAGVYALSNANGWLFVGSADDLQAALRGHLAEVGTPLRAAAPTGFTFEICESTACAGLVRRLILDLSPSCNGPAAA